MTPFSKYPIAKSQTIDPKLVIEAYKSGYFMMAKSKHDNEVTWLSPRKRAIINIENFKLTRSLKKELKKDLFKFTHNLAFKEVIDNCADLRADTWINAPIKEVFLKLHKMHYAYSFEVWHNNRLVGGLYGLALARAFFGESMFSIKKNTSKMALAYLINLLDKNNFTLLDCQIQTEHLASLGAYEVSDIKYQQILNAAIKDQALLTKFVA